MIEIPPSMVVRRDKLGKFTLDSGKRRELMEKFKEDLGLVDELYPLNAPPTIARVMKTKGIVTRDL